MATQRTTYAKRERDRARQAKAAAKRERRQNRSEDAADVAERGNPDEPLTPEELFAEIEEVHRAFAAEEISHEEFEEKKSELLARLPID